MLPVELWEPRYKSSSPPVDRKYQKGNQNRVSKKNRQHNGRKKKDNRTNNDLQNTAHTIKDRVTQTW